MVAEAVGRLSLDGSPFRQELDKTARDADTGIGTTFKRLGGIIAGAFTVSTLKNFAQEAMRNADEVDNLSKRLNIGAEATQALKVMTEEAGLQMGDMQAVLLKLSSQTARATAGNKEMAAAFDSIGISMEDMQNMSVEQMLDAVSRAMYEGRSSADVMNAAVRIFGEDTAPKMRSLLEDIGQKGLPATIQGFKELGQVIDGDTIQKLDKAEETVSRFWTKFNRNNTEAFADALSFISEAFGKSMGDSAELSDWVLEKKKRIDEEDERMARENELRLKQQSELQKEILALENEQVKLSEKAKGEQERLTEAKRRESEIVEELRMLDGDGIENYRDQLKLQNELMMVRKSIGDIETKQAADREKAQQEEARAAERMARLRDQLSKIEYDRLDTAGKLAVRQDDLNRLTEKRAELEKAGAVETEEYLRLMIDIANAEKDVTGLKTEQARQADDAKKKVVEQVEQIEKMKSLLASMTDEEMQRFIKGIEDMTRRLAALPDVQGLEWMDKIADFKLPANITEGKARQLADAIVSFVNTLNQKLGALPQMKWLEELKPLADFKLPTNLTEGKARQVADSIVTLVNGLKGLGGPGMDIDKLNKSLTVIEALTKLGARGGKWELEVKLPPGFNGLLPVGFDQTMTSIDVSLKTLAQMRGIAWH